MSTPPSRLPEDATLQRRPRTQALEIAVTIRLVGLLVVIVGTLFIFGGTIGPQEVPMPAFLVPAIVVAALLISAATLVPKLYEGIMVQPLSDALVLLSVCSFVSIMLYVQPRILPEELGALAPTILLLGGLLAATGMVKSLSERGGLALRSATLIAASVLVLLSVPPALLGADLRVFQAWASGGLLVVAFLSLLPLLRGRRDPYVRAAGALMANDSLVGVAVSAVLLVSLYYAAARPSLVDQAPDLLVLAEWVALGAAALIGCGLLYSYLKKEGGEEGPGELRRHVPAVQGFKPELQRAAGAVNAFVAEGRKEDLVAMMGAVLRANGASEPEVAQALQGIERYRASRGADDAEARRDREALVSETVARMTSAARAGRLTKGRDSAGAAQG